MSIPWETIRPALAKLFCDLGGLQVQHQDKARAFVDPKQQAQVLLLVRREEEIGIDDRRVIDSKVSKPKLNITFTQNGHRRVNLDVRVESFRHDDDRFAFNAAGKIRTGLGFPSSLARLRALNIAIIRKHPIVDVPNIINDQRITSAAVLDLELNIGICTEDTKNPTSSIETVVTPKGTFITC